MTPGDLLYLPRGEVHAAVPEEQPSMHLTIGIAEQTGVDFIAWLATKAKEVVALRRDLGATLPREARVARDRELIQSILDLLETATVDEFEALQATQRSLRPLASFGIAGRLTPTSRLVSALRREVDLMVEREGAAQLVIGEQRFRLSLNERLALANINHLGTVSFGALTEELAGKMSVNDLAKAIQELAEKSLVAIAED
ncbi:MAG: JmjC domain-containing protein [Niveispirillum sp.]|uniref:JmjC domain-containing protein n=1 Tax=Niveispirillum sp. TaxID=1917217 RepID=UPI00403525D9